MTSNGKKILAVIYQSESDKDNAMSISSEVKIKGTKEALEPH